MSRPNDLILQGLLEPASLERFSPGQWDLLVRQGRRANVLSRLALLLQGRKGSEYLFAPARAHLEAAAVIARQQEVAIRWEVSCIQAALQESGVPLVLLKGAAYVMANLPVAQGRVFSDVDILLPRAQIADAESALMLHGWISSHHDAYYQRYYRQWMHEIPPMLHVRRGTVIDVHHAILPETARIRANSAAMLAAAVPVPGMPGVAVLAPMDMVLHSATHLFHEGEFDNGLRDLLDLDGLLRHFGLQADFWSALVPRAVQVGLVRPLYYALHYASLILGTPVPGEVMAAAKTQGGPGPVTGWLMDACMLRALRPNHPSCADRWTGLARWLLYVRSHWLRMPLPLLLLHLTRKALVKETAVQESRAEDQGAQP
ncbi:nucleotidyltransferase family protein [Chitinimonas sp.]|uniref:nucleotidyltransferase domain-containing protein n=1 Tax=Chitinimonas sp. TaxID=1934313 RepID=UPI002F941DA1